APHAAPPPDLSGHKTNHASVSLRQGQAYFHQAIRALLANKVRSALSVLGILIGVAAVIAMLAVGTGAQKSLEQRLSSLGTNLLVLFPGSRAVGGVQQGVGATSRITLSDAQALTKVPMVKRVAPEVSGHVQVTYEDKNWSTSLTGTTPNYAEMKDDQPVYGRFISNDDVKKRNRVAVLGLTVIKNLFGNNTNPVGEWIKINRVSFQVIGVLPVKGSNGFQDRDDAIVVPVTTAMYRLFGKQYVNMVDIEADSAQDTAPVQTAVVNFMVALKHIVGTPESPASDAFQVRNMADIQATLSASTQIMTILLSSIAAISLLVGGIGIMNIMLVSVTERTREIGLRKAIGARRVDILSQFLIESVAVSLMGGVMGITLGWIATVLISSLAGWETIVTPFSVILASGFSFLVGIVFGIWPAYKASRLSPIMALRYE
ncbi:MAG: ABC transporter permease, partial [bacterium]